MKSFPSGIDTFPLYINEGFILNCEYLPNAMNHFPIGGEQG